MLLRRSFLISSRNSGFLQAQQRVVVNSISLNNRAYFSQNTNGGNGAKTEGDAKQQNGQQQDDEVVQLKNELRRVKDDLLYCLADQENTRRIAKKDVADARAFGIKEFAKSILEVTDTLQRATLSMETYETNDPSVITFIQGVKATEHNLVKTLKTHGVEAFGAPGEKFDPNRCEALAEIPDPFHPPGTISQVLRRGWVLNGRVLRAAQVLTATTPPPMGPAVLERKVNADEDAQDEDIIVNEKGNNGNNGNGSGRNN